MGLLELIREHKQQEVDRRKKIAPLERFMKHLELASPPSLQELFPKESINIIGEIKRKSPSKGVLVENYNPSELARVYEPYCKAISVLTDESYFGGNLLDIGKVKQATNLPVLRKDFIIDEYQIFESRKYGADLVLLIARLLSQQQLEEYCISAETYGMHALVEVRTEKEVEQALASNAKLLGINHRDLDTQRIDMQRAKYLSKYISKDHWIIAESGISTKQDIQDLQPYVQGFLIGTALLTNRYPERKLQELLA